ncbi:MAG: Isomerizing Glutamine-fructose-6-phosphate aminotransferase [Candidatus Azambacteria bacterium GW2011_GWA2_42_9]|uniref:Glutamine--fructose-6-phosphate aminotransferase [isomerizing] n=3 Tax=Candidatus Azamiibacteriota TaxID=1752741 RepID=A0A0G1BGR0_9BACT|nr:MAG: Isomerizing Glutamine-fructose-6-phosphate aminotransferase [Candidatus Azambacteria bacterium GW2011_GWB1_42_17]KKS45516.1 MAG: Isomerizing Glutamine-fructose-6-phosphate aminotransferase [Candidatus Azambacteria bacterium GW2011_GWA1_42_19]KKS74714.1 MAG: Isomerizing Glutamine-fructose-6-phosphate aminotransferase [Candidatus Azambacteria bacterium GW2011_GWA2_42_9]KKS87808.1 MAG: glucosamine/fructose-6-phosphate aminotransferase, isomerizing, glucosamine-fructose-6-phosphate aminotran
MCGIVGYIGNKKAAPILIEGLKRLEYRGYDSAGIAVLDSNRVHLVKAKGRVVELQKKLSWDLGGNLGIAHTRWATHGEPSEKNAHPHTDCDGRVFVCHNGIIENYKLLKEGLILRGHIFKSDTDTEVLAHLIEENLRYGDEAFSRALKKIKGTYGLAVIIKSRPNKIFAARNSSPLVIGVGKDENIVASDASAILGRTRDVIYLNDGEIAIITKDDVKLQSLKVQKFNSSKRPQILKVAERKEKLDFNLDDAQKSGFPHFMLKEIFEQPESLANSLRGRIIKNNSLAKLGGLESVREQLKSIERLIITGCGTAYLAGVVGKLMIEELCGIPCEAELASELRYRNFFPEKRNLAMVAVSQSGETADTLAVLRRAKGKSINGMTGSKNDMLTLGVVNVVGSTIARETDAGVYNHAGPEIGVASTKAFTSQLIILALIALFLGRERGTISPKMGKQIAEEIEVLPKMIKQILKQSDQIKNIAEEYKNFNNFLYIGRKYNFPVAFEGALKLKEISYIHAEGYGAGEMKHGPIAMIDENFPTVAIVPEDSVYEKMISNLEEIKARRGNIIAITTEGNDKISYIAKNWLYIPKTIEILTPILSVIPLQLFAYYMGTLRGCDVDKPRNLAKSVTVE